jgi:L-threonylcarbamoyladenylate synthase
MVIPDNNKSHILAAAIIRRGGLIAFRTDTFYGLGVDPFNEAALRALRELKGREEAKPILVLIADVSDVDRFISERSALFDRVCERYWPGPLTLVDKARKELPDELTARTETIGVRLPDDKGVRDLIRACGGALTGTSANLSGHPPARTAQEVETYFPTGLDLIIDGREVLVSEPSSLLDLSGEEPLMIREGAIKLKDLHATLI